MKKEYKKMDASLLHLSNKRILLKLIKERQQISRSTLAKITGLTPPSITRIVDELVQDDQLVEYVGVGNSNGGRPPVMVKFKSTKNYIIGIDLGATYIRGCLVDLNAHCISEIQTPTEINQGFTHIIDEVITVIKKLQKRKEENARIWGIGLGVAGLVNRETGVIESSPDFGWTNINLHEELDKHLDIPFFYDNSTRLMALGELKLGIQPNQKNFAVLNVGYGIASGLVVEGNLVKGHSGFGGELGHISVNTDSKVQCHCGKYGCLEALASGHRIAALGKQELEAGNAEILKNLCNGNADLVTAELVAKAAKMGDPASIKIYKDVANYVAKGVSIVSNLLNPETIYIGGGISLSGDLFFDEIEKRKQEYLFPRNSTVQILPSSFGDQATTIGAVSLVLEKILNLDFRVYKT